jgi:phosphoribosyl-ATP pyrophosphohydrolase/phosphoribosyl-AMP cyclohydrolase
MNNIKIDFKKYADGLVPCIVQDEATNKVLMLGFMNEEAFAKTEELKVVTFYSRTKQRLWTKGEESGNFLHLKSIAIDCDFDTLLIKVLPQGAVCHTGADTCFNEKNEQPHFIFELEKIISQRKHSADEKSYTKRLFASGINKIAQKVGEEAVELVIEAKDNNDELFKNEAADLLFHYIILLQAKGFSLADIQLVLEERHFAKK